MSGIGYDSLILSVSWSCEFCFRTQRRIVLTGGSTARTPTLIAFALGAFP